MSRANTPVTLSVRVPQEIRDQLEELSGATGRTKSFLALEAIQSFLVAQAWQVKAINEAVKKADSADARFVSHDAVADWVASWGSQNEKDMPK